MTTMTVVRPGMLTTVQDLGRWGYQDSGVPVAGPMDLYSHRLANRIAGNAAHAAALEVTLIGPELLAQGDVMCAVAGAAFDVTVSGQRVEMHRAFPVGAGQTLKFGERQHGARATLAVRGGFEVEPVFGSRATSLVSRMGPFGGRALAGGDILSVGTELSPLADDQPVVPLAMPQGGARVRIIPGPHASMFTPAALGTLFSARYTVTPQSNRMGYRLEGPPLQHSGAAEVLSDATAIGSLQVPASGQPILLMADRQTTGGYPKIGTVITADLPLAGQLAPGDWIEFVECSLADAVEALAQREAQLAGTVA